MLRTCTLILAFVILSGCKIAVILVEGGEVQSTTSGTCQITPTVPQTGTVCIHEVNDTNYSESFTAVPDPGWRFVKWNTGGDFFCQDSTAPVCVVSNVGSVGNASIEAIVASEKAYYIMPIFSDNAPIVDTVLAVGKEWAQPYLFAPIHSWSDIDAVCPAANGGACSGSLNGWNMTGWTWASVSDVGQLFNHYILIAGGVTFGPSPDFNVMSLTSGEFFFAQGWVPTSEIPFEGETQTALEGYMADSVYLGTVAVMPGLGLDLTAWGTDGTVGTTNPDHRGGWFYRTP